MDPDGAAATPMHGEAAASRTGDHQVEESGPTTQVYAINEFITKKIPTDVTDPRADECKKYLGMAERIARSLTRVVTIPANMATMIEDIKSSAMAMAKGDTLALPGAPLPSRCCGIPPLSRPISSSRRRRNDALLAAARPPRAPRRGPRRSVLRAAGEG
eukprot:6073394-Pyramimonas_sp.AAC.1